MISSCHVQCLVCWCFLVVAVSKNIVCIVLYMLYYWVSIKSQKRLQNYNWVSVLAFMCEQFKRKLSYTINVLNNILYKTPFTWREVKFFLFFLRSNHTQHTYIHVYLWLNFFCVERWVSRMKFYGIVELLLFFGQIVAMNAYSHAYTTHLFILHTHPFFCTFIFALEWTMHWGTCFFSGVRRAIQESFHQGLLSFSEFGRVSRMRAIIIMYSCKHSKSYER